MIIAASLQRSAEMTKTPENDPFSFLPNAVGREQDVRAGGLPFAQVPRHKLHWVHTLHQPRNGANPLKMHNSTTYPQDVVDEPKQVRTVDRGRRDVPGLSVPRAAL